MKNHFLKYANWSIIALAFVISWSVALSHIIFVLFLLLWILSGNYQDKWKRIKQSPIAWLCLTLVAWIILSTLWSPADSATQKNLLDKYSKLLALPLFASTLSDEDTQLKILKAYFCGIVILMMSSIAQVLGWSGGKIGMRYGHTEYSGLMTTVVHGPLVALMIYLSFIFAWQNQRYRLIFITLACWGLLDLIFLIFNRTAFLVLAPLLITLSWTVIRKTQHPRLLAALFTITCIGLAFSPVMQDRINSIVQEISTFNVEQNQTSSGIRLFYLQLTGHMFLEHPLIGHGIGAFRHLIHDTQQYPNELSTHWHSHNTYMNLAADFGTIGLLIYASILLYAIKNIRAHSNTLIKFSSIGGLITIIFSGMTDSVIHLLGYMPMIFLALTIKLNNSNISTKKLS